MTLEVFPTIKGFDVVGAVARFLEERVYRGPAQEARRVMRRVGEEHDHPLPGGARVGVELLGGCPALACPPRKRGSLS